MGRIRNHLAFFAIIQFFVFLLAVGVYAQHDSKPTGWWQFDEGMGSSVSDASGNDDHGRVTGAEWIKDEYGGALRFDGQDDCVWCDEQGSSLSPDSADYNQLSRRILTQEALAGYLSSKWRD